MQFRPVPLQIHSYVRTLKLSNFLNIMVRRSLQFELRFAGEPIVGEDC